MADPVGHNGDPNAGDALWDDNQVPGSRLMSQEGVYQLTQDLRRFSETLTCLKSAFCEEKDVLEQSLRVVSHERLGDLLKVLKSIVHKYTELNSQGILNAAEDLINHIKNFNYESDDEIVPPEIFTAINNLALAFSSSVSECLIGDINISPRDSIVSSHSYENLNPQQSSHQRQLSLTSEPVDTGTTTDGHAQSPDAIADVLEHVHQNLDIGFERAKAWSKYANDLITYIKKKAHIELEYAKQLIKLSQTTRSMLSDQSFLPFQSLYCTALDHDKDYASNLSTTYHTLLLAHKFVEPLQAKRLEHDRQQKIMREAWRKDKRRLEEAEVNLKKAKQQYQIRNQEYQKAKDAAIKAESDQHQQLAAADAQQTRQGGISGSFVPSSVPVNPALTILPSSKMEKKKKQEDDSYLKAAQAEYYYRACVNETNLRRDELEKKEEQYLKTLRELMTQCDQTTKAVTLSFFQLHYQLSAPLPVQYQALLEDSKLYEPGFQYAEYLKHVTPHHAITRVDYQFEPFVTEGSMYTEQGARAETGNMLEDASPLSGRTRGANRYNARRPSHKGTGFSDTESSSSRSLDETSPSASPGDPPNRKNAYNRRHSNEGSLSSEEILDDGPKEISDGNHLFPPAPEQTASWSPDSSPAPTRSQKKLLNIMKEKFKGIKRMPKPTVFGVDFSVAVQDNVDGVPSLVKKCIAEIDNRALTVKGIYRVNGVKNRVEKLCALLDTPNAIRADLSEQLPHDVSGVLKYFLRQLPEPLLLHRFYNEFLDVAKEYQMLVKDSKSNAEAINSEEEMGNSPALLEKEEEEREVKYLSCMSRIRSVVEKLPTANRHTLQYIIAHLSRVAEHHKENKMTTSNLAIIFGPTLLRPEMEVGNELQSLIELPAQSQTIEMLISHRDKIFDTYSHHAQSADQIKRISTHQPTTNDTLHINERESKSVSKDGNETLLVQIDNATGNSACDPPATTDQVHLILDDDQPSPALGNLTPLDPVLPETISEERSADDITEEFFTDQSNGGMNVIDDKGTSIPCSAGVREATQQYEITGVIGKEWAGQNTSVNAYLENKNPDLRLLPASPCRPKKNLVRQPQTNRSDFKPLHSSIVPESSQSPKTTSNMVKNKDKVDVPVAPVRNKTKGKKKNSTDHIQEGGADEEIQSEKKPVSHRPRSRHINDFGRLTALVHSDTKSTEQNNPLTGEQRDRNRKISLTLDSAAMVKTKRTSDKKPVEIPTESSGTGRKLPKVPAAKNQSTSPSRKGVSRPKSMPGRTPPFNKTPAWTFSKTAIADLDSPSKDADIQKKILMADDEEEEVSFC